MQQMELNRILREKAISLGADFFGVADLTLAKDAIVEQGGDELVEFPRGISMGIALMNTIVDQLPQRARKAVAVSYRHHYYHIINQRLDLITSVISGYLQQAGYKALPIPASERVDNERICSLFSHKLAAHLAGLGWIGKNCLLINPEVGPRARWATVLVDAPLEPTGKPTEERCGSCQECVDICPVKAFTGRPFHTGEPREMRYDAGKCDRYFKRIREKNELPVCGMCLFVCPYGRTRKSA